MNPYTVLSLTSRRRIRKMFDGCRNNMPICVIDGDSEPLITGKSFGYVTRGGRPIYHPNAYAKRGWSNMVYSPSTRRIDVGVNWLLSRIKDIDI